MSHDPGLFWSRRAIAMVGRCSLMKFRLERCPEMAALSPWQTELVHLDGELEDIVQTLRQSAGMSIELSEQL